jgi:hypothetical protein
MKRKGMPMIVPAKAKPAPKLKLSTLKRPGQK